MTKMMVAGKIDKEMRVLESFKLLGTLEFIYKFTREPKS